MGCFFYVQLWLVELEIEAHNELPAFDSNGPENLPYTPPYLEYF